MVALNEQIADTPEDLEDEGLDISSRRHRYYGRRAKDELLPAVLEIVPDIIPLRRLLGDPKKHFRLYENARHTPEAAYLLKNEFLKIQPPRNLHEATTFNTNWDNIRLFQQKHRDPEHLPLYWLLIAACAYEYGGIALLPGMDRPYEPACYLDHICYLATVRSGIHSLDAQIPRSFKEVTPEFVAAYSRAARKYQTEITCERMRSGKDAFSTYDTQIKQAYHVARTQGFRDKERMMFGVDALRYFHPKNNLTSAIAFLYNDPSDQQTALATDPQDPAIPFKFYKCLAPAFMPFDKTILTCNDLGRAILDRYLHNGSEREYKHPLHPLNCGFSTEHTELFYRFATRRIQSPHLDRMQDDGDDRNEPYELIPNTRYLGTSRLVIVPQPAWQTFYPTFWRDRIANHPDARLLHCLAKGDGTYFHHPVKLFQQNAILSQFDRTRKQPAAESKNGDITGNGTTGIKPVAQPTIIIDQANTDLIKQGTNQLRVYTGPLINFPDSDVDVHIRISQVHIPQGILTQGNLIFDAPFASAVYTHRVSVSSILQEEKPEKGQKHILSASHDIIVACSLQALDLIINTLQDIEVDGDLWCSAVRADGNIRVAEHLMAAEIQTGGCVEANRITGRDLIAADRIFARTEIRATMIRSLECFAASGLKVPKEFEDPTGATSKGIEALVTVG